MRFVIARSASSPTSIGFRTSSPTWTLRTAQLSRRSIDIHLPRYRAEDPEDRQMFINIVKTFEKALPFEGSSDLVADWEFLYERSLGCIGILKEWLVRAATVASRMGLNRLTRANLQSQALSIAQCEQMHTETAHGELKLHEGSQASVRLRSRLGLSTQAPTKTDLIAGSSFGKTSPAGSQASNT